MSKANGNGKSGKNGKSNGKANGRSPSEDGKTGDIKDKTPIPRKGYSDDDKAAIKKAFIEGLSEFGTVLHGAEAAGINPDTAYRWRKVDAEFAQEWAGAIKAAQNNLERSMYERAMAGDTTAGIFMLKAFDPKKYRDRVDIHQKTEGNVEIRFAGKSPEQIRQIVRDRLGLLEVN